ncbi:hypothetical protein IAU60_001900 [Kwoniella sp. DSM 27419]
MVASYLLFGAVLSAQLATAAAISSSVNCPVSTITKVVTSTRTVTAGPTVTVTVTRGGASSVRTSSSSSRLGQSQSSASRASSSASKASTSATTSTSVGTLIVTPSGTASRSLSLNTTFIYDLDNQPIAAPVLRTASGLALNEDIYIVDMAQSTAEQIANYHAMGKTVGCYFSAGTWEPFRNDKLSFKPECYCGPGVKVDKDGKCTGKGASNNLLGEWGEWWLDLHHPTCLDNIKGVMTARIQEAKRKGCDAVDPDNVDSFMNKQNFGNTAADQVAYLLWLSATAKANGLLVDLKNAGTLLTDPDTGKTTQWTDSLVRAFDFNVIESCHQYDECDTYDPFLKAGKPQIQIEYESRIKKCPSLKAGQKLLVYDGTNVNSTKITLSCQ